MLSGGIQYEHRRCIMGNRTKSKASYLYLNLQDISYILKRISLEINNKQFISKSRAADNQVIM